MKTKIIHSTILFTIDSQFNNKTLDDFFAYFHCSKKQKHQLRMEKRIQLNHQIIQHNPILHTHDHLALDILVEEEIDYLPQDMHLNILYEDEILLILDKPIHCIIHPEHKNEMNTLVNGVSHYYHQTHQKHAIRYIHRLDQDTSGCIIFCKQPFFQPFLDDCMATKKIKRTYLALVQGKNIKKQTINAPIGKDRHQSNTYRVSPKGQSAITHITPIETFSNYSLISCQLETGRTHQIRVHCASIHHPLLSDEKYGTKDSRIKRCALHSSQVVFTHPLTNETITVTAPLPKDMKKLTE